MKICDWPRNADVVAHYSDVKGAVVTTSSFHSIL